MKVETREKVESLVKIGMLAWIIGCIVAIFTNIQNYMVYGLMLIGSIPFVLAALVYLIEKVTLVKQSYFWSYAKYSAHVISAFMALGFAKELVAKALGLPPLDFEMTLSLITAFFYPVCLVFLISISILILAIYKQVLSILQSACVSNLWLFAAIPLFASIKSWIGKQQQNSSLNNGLGTGLAFAGISLFVVISASIDYLTKQELIIRNIAYVADFQQLQKYPCIPSNAKVVIHENGVISQAKRVGFDIEIQSFHYNENCKA